MNLNLPTTEVVVLNILPGTDKAGLLFNNSEMEISGTCYRDHSVLDSICHNLRAFHLNCKGTFIVSNNISNSTTGS